MQTTGGGNKKRMYGEKKEEDGKCKETGEA